MNINLLIINEHSMLFKRLCSYFIVKTMHNDCLNLMNSLYENEAESYEKTI